MSECKEHDWVFQHVVYWADAYPLPGSGAHARMYGDRFYCRRCLETLTKNARRVGNTYEPVVAGTFPRGEQS